MELNRSVLVVKFTNSGLSFFSFLFFIFIFILFYFPIFLFLELEVRVSDNITWSHLGHIR